MATGFEDWSTHAFTSASEEEQEKAAVTAAETELTFTAPVKTFLLMNEGVNTAFFAFATGVAITHFPLYRKQPIGADLELTTIYLICAAGETATVKAIGLR